MKERKLETTIKVSGERENVGIVLDKLCGLWEVTVSPMKESRDSGCHVYITIVEVLE